jgi:hypothetical protein
MTLRHANSPDHPANQTITVTLQGGPYDGQQVELTVPQGMPRSNETVDGPAGKQGYMIAPGWKAGDNPIRMLWWRDYSDK